MNSRAPRLCCGQAVFELQYFDFVFFVGFFVVLSCLL